MLPHPIPSAVLIWKQGEYPLPAGISAAEGMRRLGLDPELYIAVRGGEVIPPETILQPGDRVQLIAVMAGG